MNKDIRWNEETHSGWKEAQATATRLKGKGIDGHALYVEVVTVTPEMAQYAIDNMNDDNHRKLRINTATRYAGDMVEDDFLINNDTIVVFPGFNLVNGQHRMMAIVEAKKPVDMLIVFGVVDHKNMDTSMRRKFADRVKNLSSPTDISGAMMEIYVQVNALGGIDSSKNAPSHNKLDKLLKFFTNDIEEACSKILPLNKRVRLGQRSKVMGLYLLFSRIDREKADELMDMLYLVKPGPSCVDKISEHLRNSVASKTGNMSRRIFVAGIIHAWNHIITGKRIPTHPDKWTVGGYPKIIGLTAMMHHYGIVERGSLKNFPQVEDMIIAGDFTNTAIDLEADICNKIIQLALKKNGSRVAVATMASRHDVSARKMNNLIDHLDACDVISVDRSGRDPKIVTDEEAAYGQSVYVKIMEAVSEATAEATTAVAN